MYVSFFGLIEKPFSITPDPRYLYLSERHAEALAHLLYGINESGGFIQLTGEVGTGKTTVVRTLLSRVPQHADVAVILNPRVTPVEFLLTICEELGLGVDEADRHSVKEMVDALNRRLLAAHADGRRVIVIVDEAQNLSAEVLEQVRLLTNLETATQKLLQIILIGQPELRELLDRTDLRQLAQRITGRYHLNPLRKAGDRTIRRPPIAGRGRIGEIFTPAALAEVHRVSSGVPRVINVVCDRALLGAYTEETKRVTPALVRRAAGEVYGRRFLPLWLGWVGGGRGTGGRCVSGVPGFELWRRNSPSSARHAGAKPRSRRRASRHRRSRGRRRAPAPGRRCRINALLAENTANTSDAAAFRRLLSLWGTAMADDKDPCGQAQKAGLACLEQRGSWAQVRALNRPAILTLTDDRGSEAPRRTLRAERQVRHVEFGRAQRARAARRAVARLVRRIHRRVEAQDASHPAAVAGHARRRGQVAAPQPERASRRGLRSGARRPVRSAARDRRTEFSARTPAERRWHRGVADASRARHRTGRSGLAAPHAPHAARLGILPRMSFILDALKKSEIERQRQSVPGLMDTGPAPRRPRFPIWAIALTALLAVNLAVLIVVLTRGGLAGLTGRAAQDARVAVPAAAPAPSGAPLPAAPAQAEATAPPVETARPSQPRRPRRRRESGATAEAGSSAQTAPPAAESNPPDHHFSPMDAAAPVYAPEIPADSGPAGGAMSAVPSHSGRASPPASAMAGARERDPLLTSGDDKSDQEVLPTISELDLTGANALPEMHLDVHVYATKAAERFVYINMRKYREGATLAEGPVLERIRRDGVVLDYHGLRFVLPRQ